MDLRMLIKRAIRYYKSRGLVQTISRTAVSVKRLLFHSKTIIYSACVSDLENSKYPSVDEYTVQRIRERDGFSSEDFDALLKYYDKTVLEHQLTQRFNLGAEIWLIKENNELLGFNWSIINSSIGKYFFPLLERDVFIFDQIVFNEFRGRGINAKLTMHILRTLKQENIMRAYISMKEWNKANVKAISKTAFQKIGKARKMNFFGREIVIWSDM